jgi:hypothetical protein
VVPRRSHECDAALDGSIDDRIDECDCPARRKLRDLDALLADVRIGIDVTRLPIERAEPFDEALVVNARKLFVGDRSRLDGIEGEAELLGAALDRGVGSLQPLRSLRMVRARAVPKKTRVEEKSRASD